MSGRTLFGSPHAGQPSIIMSPDHRPWTRIPGFHPTDQTDAGSGQQSGKRECEIEVPLGCDLRSLGEGVDQPLRRE
jgi:hypothetical protein